MLFLSARRALVVLLAITCLGLANPALAHDDYASSIRQPSAAAMGFDALIVRPAGLVATVLGSGLFVVSLPFSLLGMNVGEAGERLVVEPAKYTFVRPLGDFQASRPAR